jgi:acyl carrier protein
LPPAMVPSDFTWVDAFPLTSNGKIDRAALLSEPRRPTTSAASTSDAVQAKVARLVADVLDRPSVSSDDNFLLLGGHSLLAAALLVRITDGFDVDLPLSTVFDHPTVAEIAHEVRRRVGER